ncbi:MAG: hypothetical protein U9R49_11440 [Bacteroidota bacterium]|nr:hypothetical protein [Bacteroidota bacterium]
MSDLNSFLKMGGVECLALCDVDRNVLVRRAAEVEKVQGKKAVLYDDCRPEKVWQRGTGEIIGDEKAAALTRASYRSPWTLPRL